MKLSLLAIAQFMVLLDLTIVNVALPSLRADLSLSQEELLSVISAYALVFAGFWLLGARLADLLGRRRLFLVGMVLFGSASLLAGVAGTPEQLIGFRCVQGLGGALLSPAAFGLATALFPHGRHRTIALSIWGALSGLGATFGVVIGGALVDTVSWRWVFLVNVPIAVAVIALSPVLLTESRVPVLGPRSFDIAGALLGTTGLLAIVLGIVRADALGWFSLPVLLLLEAGLLLLVVFVRVELRAPAPLVPMSLFRARAMTGLMINMAGNGATLLAFWFLISIFLQEARGETALVTGLYLLPVGITGSVGAITASRFLARHGIKSVMVGSALLSAAGLLLVSQADVRSSYVTTLLPGLALFGLGLIGTQTAGQISAVAEAGPDEAATAGGVVSSAGQVGCVVGLVLASTAATHQMNHLVAPVPRLLSRSPVGSDVDYRSPLLLPC
ncbi:MFS transporter [Paractinoplanes brasiliensis]|nr:MFS transporter [Actinoplanes brasiliensis]